MLQQRSFGEARIGVDCLRLLKGGSGMPTTESSPYHTPNNGASWYLSDSKEVPDEQLDIWAHDPNCIEMEACAGALAKRRKREAERQARALAEIQQLVERRKRLEENPFDPRTEVSEDARYISGRIVKHLWILFVLLPLVVFLFLLFLSIIGLVK
jgi:hypothetical protein